MPLFTTCKGLVDVLFFHAIFLVHLTQASIAPQWSTWTNAFPCTVTCGNGLAERIRMCSTGNPRDCHGAPWEVYTCYLHRCTLDSTTTSVKSAPTSNTPGLTSTIEFTTTTKQMKSSTSSISKFSSTSKSTTATLGSTSWIFSTSENTSPKTFSPSTKLVTSTTGQTTPKANTHVGNTIAPVTTMCAQCLGPTSQCEVLYYPMACEPPNNYCINQIHNTNDGSRYVNRSCGNFDTCYKEWYLGSSNKEFCQTYNEQSVVTSNFDCTFCCVTDKCNIPLKPRVEDLYTDL